METVKSISFKDKIHSFLLKLQPVKTDEKIFFSKTLAVMIKAGLSLSHAFKILAQQTNNKKFKLALLNIQNDVEAGLSLADSLAKHPDIFSEIFVNMIRAGESSGQLEKVLEEITSQMKKTRELTSKIKKAVTYPVFIVGIMIAIGIFAITFIVPKMTSIFLEMNVALPLPTRILIGLSNFMVNQWYIILPALIIVIFFLWQFGKTTKGRYFFHSLYLKLPVFGPLIKKINLIKFSRTFSSLLASGISLVQTFKITARVLGNVVYREKIIQLSQETTRGVTISSILEKYPDLFPPVVTQMIEVGEKTGTLENILADVIEFYEDDVDETLTNFTAIIEPFLIVLLGIGVGMMALAVIMPMYSLVEAI